MARYCSPQDSVRTRWSPLYRATIFTNVVHGTKSMSCANNVLPVYMWPSPEKIPEGLCLRPVQVDTVHFSPEATETNGFSCVSSSLNRTAVISNTNQGRNCPVALKMSQRLSCGAHDTRLLVFQEFDRKADAFVEKEEFPAIMRELLSKLTHNVESSLTL